MDNSFDVADPSDWLSTSVSGLGPVEAALRCQVCKDFFDTPMITSCSHTFCSLCIRRCLTTDSRCPACRAQDQEIKLRPNSIIQELVDVFQVARPGILQLGEDVKAMKETNMGASKKRKRKREMVDDSEDEAFGEEEMPGRRTRSQYKNLPASTNLLSAQSGENIKDMVTPPEDGLIACPICNARMKEEEVFSHLDVHNGQNPVFKSQPTSTRSPHFNNLPSGSRPPPKAPERLPQLNYSLLKDNALRKRLSELGISNSGPRPLLIRRHTEWINLVNANCDSTRPRTKRELLHELDVWDKTQGRQILNSSNGGGSALSVMHKDFDGAGWAANHDQDFRSLIAKARAKSAIKNESTSNPDQSDQTRSAYDDTHRDMSVRSSPEHAKSIISDSPPKDVMENSPDRQVHPTQAIVDLNADG